MEWGPINNVHCLPKEKQLWCNIIHLFLSNKFKLTEDTGYTWLNAGLHRRSAY